MHSKKASSSGQYLHIEEVHSALQFPKSLKTLERHLRECRALFNAPIPPIPAFFHVSQLEEIRQLLLNLQQHKFAKRREKATKL